ncbi:hypothetical protein [Legionella pneumophila]
MSEIYQNSIVAFIDLLGFKSALKKEENAKEILNILYQMKEGERNGCNVSTQVNGLNIEIQVQPAVSVFSDSMVISVSEKVFNKDVSWRHAVIEILNIVQQLANFVIERGFLLRGGMSLGKLYHEKGVVFGPALVEAYTLESEHAKNPRILVCPKLVDCFNEDKNGGTFNCFLQDELDGEYYLDYLPTALLYSSQNYTYQSVIQQKIITMMKAASTDKREIKILEKWFWFEAYHQRTIDKIAIPEVC